MCMYDDYFLIREQYFLDFITEFVFDGFSLDTTRSMVDMHDVSFQSKITVVYTGTKPVLGLNCTMQYFLCRSNSKRAQSLWLCTSTNIFNDISNVLLSV